MRLFLLLMFLNVLTFAQESEVHSHNLSYNPNNFNKNGYVIDKVTVLYTFKNCFGEASYIMAIKKSTVQSTGYYYKGQFYSAFEIGQEYFDEIYIPMGSDFEGDLYQSGAYLGHVKIGNLVGGGLGCAGETYDLFKQLGLQATDYKEAIHDLSVSNLRITNMDVASTKIERLLESRLKEQEYNRLINEADNLFSKEDYEGAIAMYKKATYIKDEQYPRDQIEKAKALKEKIDKEKKIYQLMSEGDELLSDEKFDAAISKYQEVLRIDPEYAEAKSKIEEAQRLKEEKAQKDAEEEAEKQAEENEDEDYESSYNEEYERQKRIQEYYQKKNELTQENMYVADQMGAAAALVHYAIGKKIYGPMGNDKENSRLIGDSYHFSIYGGYGLSSKPIFTNSYYLMYDGNNLIDDQRTMNSQTFTVDLSAGVEYWPLMGRNKGWGGFVEAGAGHGVLFQHYSTQGQLGVKGFFGTDKLKLYGEYSMGYRYSRYIPWVDAMEYGSGGRSSYTYSKFSVGPRFTFNGNLRGETMCHMDIRPIFEYTKSDLRYYGNNPLVFNWQNGIHTSFWLENRMRIFFEYFWDYVRTGDVEYGFDEETTFSGQMIRLGFYRSMDTFGKTSYSFDKEEVRDLSKKKHKLSLYLMNPTINWIQPDQDTAQVGLERIYMNEPTVGINPIGIEKEINLFRWFSVSAGGHLKLNSGGKYNVSPDSSLTVLGFQRDPGTRLRHQMLAMELPITARFYLNYHGVNKYWLAAGYSKQVNIFSFNQYQDPESGNYLSLDEEENTMNRMADTRFVQAGIDYSINGQKLLRAAVKYNQGMTSLFSDNPYIRTGSITLQFALIY